MSPSRSRSSHASELPDGSALSITSRGRTKSASASLAVSYIFFARECQTAASLASASHTARGRGRGVVADVQNVVAVEVPADRNCVVRLDERRLFAEQLVQLPLAPHVEASFLALTVRVE